MTDAWVRWPVVRRISAQIFWVTTTVPLATKTMLYAISEGANLSFAKDFSRFYTTFDKGGPLFTEF